MDWEFSPEQYNSDATENEHEKLVKKKIKVVYKKKARPAYDDKHAWINFGRHKRFLNRKFL